MAMRFSSICESDRIHWKYVLFLCPYDLRAGKGKNLSGIFLQASVHIIIKIRKENKLILSIISK